MAGRKSKLTPAQWAEIEARLIAGESRRALGREFGITETSIRHHFGGDIEKIKVVAGKIVEANIALRELPPLVRNTAQNLACKLIEISDNLAMAAVHGSATAHRLNALANSEVARVDDADPMASLDSLRNVGVLTKLANDSASIGLNLLSANKERIAKLNEIEEAPEHPGVLVVPGVIQDQKAWTKLVQSK